MYGLNRQGDNLTHYLALGIQPLEFSMANGYDACAHTILKYISRHARKGGRVDLEKAIHIVEVRDELTRPTQFRQALAILNTLVVAIVGYKPTEKEDPRISVEVYIERNKLGPLEAEALVWLDQWLRHPPSLSVNATYSDRLTRSIQKIIDANYGEHQ